MSSLKNGTEPTLVAAAKKLMMPTIARRPFFSSLICFKLKIIILYINYFN